MRNLIVCFALLTVFLGQGCSESVISPQIAVPFVPITEEVVDYKLGFGPLPGTLWATTTGKGAVRIRADLPSLLPDVTVIRLSGSGLDQNKFQNLTHALGMPVGLIGDNPQNLSYVFTWTNDQRIVWSFDSEKNRLTSANAAHSPARTPVPSWPDEILLVRAVKSYLDERGVDPYTYRNISIQHDWQTWAERVKSGQTCITPDIRNELQTIQSATDLLTRNPPAERTGDCQAPVYPSRVLMTFERVIDERNIVDRRGNPELGGMMVINAQTNEIEYGWYLFAQDALRSEYPAISAQTMRERMEHGGLGGVPSGMVDIDEVYFSYIRVPNPDPYAEHYLAPAIVGKGTHELDDGTTEPYHIVVPLIKE